MPGLLDRPRHTVVVQPRKDGKAPGGIIGLVADGAPVTIRCTVQPVREWSTAEEQILDGIQLLSLRRVFARTWAGDSRALVTYRGKQYEIVGDPQFLDTGSRATWHWEITLKQVGSA